jgi:hypothetical protein
MDIRYLAGFFDGEGCCYKKLFRGCKTPVLLLKITQKDPKVLNLIVRHYGGWVEAGGKKGVPRWVCRGERARTIARDMMPFLVIKKKALSKLLPKQTK